MTHGDVQGGTRVGRGRRLGTVGFALVTALLVSGIHDGESTPVSVAREKLRGVLRCSPNINSTLCLADCFVEEHFENGNVRCGCHQYECKVDAFDRGNCSSNRGWVVYETVDPALDSCPERAKK